MATGAAMAKSHEGLAGIDRFMEDFRWRFGHLFDSAGYHGHPCFGYNCRRCGIHISLVRPRRWLEAECKGNFRDWHYRSLPGLRREQRNEL